MAAARAEGAVGRSCHSKGRKLQLHKVRDAQSSAYILLIVKSTILYRLNLLGHVPCPMLYCNDNKSISTG